MMYRCCIFDLDGTLINTIHALTRTINMTLAKYGLGPIEDESTKLFVGDGYKRFVERALNYCGDVELEHLDSALFVYDALFKENGLYHIEAYEGMKELLDTLKSRGMKIAVVTNKNHERAIENIELVYGTDYFDLIMGEQDGIRRKPDPAMALMTAEKLGVSPSECLYFGDTNTDMKTGMNAGMDTVGVTWGFRGREELEEFHPKFIIDKPGDIIPAIEAAKQDTM